MALYCAKYLPEFLKKLEDYTNGNFEEALKKLFLKFDESLLTPEALNELKELRDMSSEKSSLKDEKEENGHVSGDSENDEEPEYENEAAQLCDEATMPLEEVLKRYTRTENKMKRSLKKKGIIRASSSVEEKPASFQEQEERDMYEIKKNSNLDQENGSHDQEYDEASNLGEISDSQKSGMICESSSLQVAENSLSKSGLLSTETKKLNKEEIKLSPIRKKSSSLVIDDVSSIVSDNTVLNGSNGQPGSSNEENKENDFEKSSSNQPEVNGDLKKDENGSVTEKKTKSAKKSSSTNLIAKLIAGVVNSKLKNSLKNSKNSKDKVSAEENEDDAEDEEKDDDYDEENDDDDDNDEEEEEESGDEDDDDDEEDEDDDYDEDDDEEEEEIDIDAAQSFSLDSRPGYDSGCTAVVALLKETKLYVANAGDSRCVVCRDGKAIEMSFDHKPEDEIERHRIEKAGGTVTKDGRVNSGLNLSRAIGDHTYKANKTLSLSEQMITPLPDLKILDIDPTKDKFMVLACDGIWNFMSSQEVCDYIQERLNANYAKLSLICEEMFMHCLAPDAEGDGTGCDNMTCIIVTFSPFRKILVKIANGDAEKNNLKRTHDEENEKSKLEINEAETKKLKQESE